jgi:hypothetical protein
MSPMRSRSRPPPHPCSAIPSCSRNGITSRGSRLPHSTSTRGRALDRDDGSVGGATGSERGGGGSQVTATGQIEPAIGLIAEFRRPSRKSVDLSGGRANMLAKWPVGAAP